MSFYVIGLNIEKHDVSIRERYALLPEEIIKYNKMLKDECYVEEVVTLSTCNRIEYYIYSKRSVNAVIDRIFDVEIKEDLLKLEGTKASHHLLEVSSGLKSQIIGEGEILGQIKKAYSEAQKNKLTGSYLNTLFQKAIYVGKKVRTITNISKLSLSTGGILLDNLKSYFEDIYGLKVLLIGIGEISRQIATSFYKKGVEKIYITNRLLEEGRRFAKEMEASYIPLNELYTSLKDMDVIISSTTAPHYILTEDHYKLFKSGKKMLVDLAVPRDIEPSLGEHEDVKLLNIDQIETVSRVNDEKRRDEISKVEEILSLENCLFCTSRLYSKDLNECKIPTRYDIKEIKKHQKTNYKNKDV